MEKATKRLPVRAALRTKWRQTHGVTLLELVIAVTIVGVVGLGTAAILGTAQRYLAQTVAMTSAQGEAAFALSHMRRRIMVANRILIYNNAGTVDRVAFRWDPAPTLPGTPTDFSDDRWSAYRLAGAGNRELEYVPDVGVAGTTNPTLGNIDSATDEVGPPVARNVATLAMRHPDDAVPLPADGDFAVVPQVQINVVIEQQTAGAGETRQAEILTVISARGTMS